MRHLLTAALLLAGTAANAQTIPVETMKEVTKELSSDAYEGRAPTTPAEDKTIAYIVQRLEKAGLKPGNKGKWTQDVPLVELTANNVQPLVFSGGKAPVSLDYRKDMVVATYRVVPKVAIKNSDVVFVGYGINAPERGWNDYAGLDVTGKTVVILVNDPDYQAPDTKGLFEGRAMTYYGRWTYKYEEAARQGAAGVLIVHETAPASYGWATVKNSNTNVMFDIVRKEPAKTHPQLEAWIQRDVAVDLFKKAGLDFDALKKQAQTRAFKPVVLNGATFSADFKVRHQVIVSHNVAGRIVGTKHPNETIIYSAHWDHLGVGAPDAKGDRIYNGAIDNADGVAAILELARAFKSRPAPQRSVLFLAVTAEEKGLLGSEYYSANPLFPLATTVGDINIDALSAAGPAKDIGTSGDGKVDLQDLLVAKAKAHGRYFTPDPMPQAGHFYRSDHFPFAKRGVPAISIGSGADLVKGGKEAGMKAEEDYTENRYHQPADEWKADWDLSGQAADIGLAYEVGADLANSRAWPQWQAGSEFKALRDKTAAQRK